jgi:molybdate transport system regulatory protein
LRALELGIRAISPKRRGKKAWDGRQHNLALTRRAVVTRGLILAGRTGELPAAITCGIQLAMTSDPSGPVARLRVVLGRDIAVGPGKADLLDGIRETGSIAAAGRRMGMSYKQAWLLIDTMNRCFAKPLVEAVKGGKSGGGAHLTKLGEQVLARYRHMQAATEEVIADDLAALKRAMRKAHD